MITNGLITGEPLPKSVDMAHIFSIRSVCSDKKCPRQQRCLKKRKIKTNTLINTISSHWPAAHRHVKTEFLASRKRLH